MPEYIDRLRTKEKFRHKSEPELELMLSGSKYLQGFTGKTAHQHRRRGMELLFPNRIWHEWREERIQSVQYCLDNRIQELSWIGSSNSNKTGDMADIALSLWWTKPESTSIYIASPYEKATQKGVWTEIREQFEEARTHYPELPGRVKKSESSIVQYDRNPRSFIEVVTVDNIGKLVGKKSKDPTEGLLVFVLDELPAFTPTAARALIAVLANLISVQNLLVIAAGNFANIWDALGIFCDPDERDIPNGYQGFNPNTHFRWRTKRGGLALRFDGLQSPNVKAGRDIYPFLTTIRYIEKLANAPGGLESPDAMRFVRSAPITSMDEFSLTNGEKIRAGGAHDPFEWTTADIKKGAFIDPGFGGDPCILQKFTLGWQAIPDGKRQIIALWGPPIEIPVRVGLEENGIPISPETQIVRESKKICEKEGIPTHHIAFDGSLRAGIVQAFGHWSLQIEAFDSMGAATDRPFNAIEKKEAKPGEIQQSVKWNERVDRLLSEMWFAAVSLIDSYQLRGLQLSPKAEKQMTLRRWSWQGKNKKKVQTKAEYKEDLKARGMPAESPNEADALVGCVEKARRMGLSLNGVTGGSSSLNLILEMIKEREARKYYASLTRGSGLPSGTLHAIKHQSSLPSGKLHRR